MSSTISVPIIFIHPISSTLKELMNYFSGPDIETPVEIYEVDSTNEASQLIASLGQSLILSSDIKKISQIFQENRKTISANNSKSILVSQKDVPHRIIEKLTHIGLTDFVLDSINFKTLQHKVRLILKTIQTNITNSAAMNMTVHSTDNSQIVIEGDITKSESSFVSGSTSSQETARSNYQEKSISTHYIGKSLKKIERPANKSNLSLMMRANFSNSTKALPEKVIAPNESSKVQNDKSFAEDSFKEIVISPKEKDSKVIVADDKIEVENIDQNVSNKVSPTALAIPREEIDYEKIKAQYINSDETYYGEIKSLDLLVQIMHKQLDRDLSLIDFLKYSTEVITKNFEGEVIFSFYNSYEGFFDEVYNSILDDSRSVISDYHVYYKQLKKESHLWQQATLPKWSDDRFEKDDNYFIFPFFHGMAHLGYAMVYFVKPFPQTKCSDLEVILEMTRSFYIKEFTSTVDPKYKMEAADYKNKKVGLWQKIKNIFKKSA